MKPNYQLRPDAAAVFEEGWKDCGWGSEKGGHIKMTGGRFRLAMLRTQQQLLELYLPEMDARTRLRALNTLEWLRGEIKRAREQARRQAAKSSQAKAKASAAA